MSDYPIAKKAYGKIGAQLSLAIVPLVFYLPLLLLAIPAILLLTGWWRWTRDHNALPVALARLAVGASLCALAVAVWLGNYALEDLAVIFFTLVASLKWLESRGRRDAIVCSQLNFFTLLLPILYDQPFWLMLTMVITAVITLYHWLIIAHPGADVLKPSRYISKLALLGLPVVVLLFVLFPRFDHPLWQLNQANKAQSGISDTMQPGSMSEIVQSAEPAFRVTFSGAAPEKDELYWKGLVLWDFDGKNWRARTERRDYQWETAIPVSSDYRYEVTLEEGGHRWLYLLDTPASLNSKEAGRFSLENEYLLQRPPEGRLKYQATSGKPASIRNLDPETASAALALPFGNLRATALGAQWAKTYPNPSDRIAAALKLFASAPFAYTLKPGLLGDNPVDEFLFESKKGFCEHYASAFTFLMRAAGVPARVVVGYAGGEYNQVGNYYLLRQANAHAWAEVYLADKGWTRIDPTAAIAPERVERSVLQLAGSRSENTQKTTTMTFGRQLSWFADSLLNDWNQLILSYDRQKQREFLAKLGLDSDKDNLYRLLAVGFGIFALIGSAWLLWPKRSHHSPEQQVFGLLTRKLAQRGFTRQVSEGERAFIERVIAAWPAPQETLLRCLRWYQSVRYGNAALDKPLMKQIVRLIRQLPRRPKPWR